MSKQLWKAGNMLYPLPAVLVSCADREGHANILTVAWTGTICSDPAMVYISVRKSRFSHEILKDTGEFFINLTTEALAFATDYCGVKSGRDINKFEQLNLTPVMGILKYAPMIDESPVCIACEVTQVLELGSHDMFMANVKGVYADEAYMDETGRFDLAKAAPMVYSHGQYYGLGAYLGKFGYSVQKKKSRHKRKDR
jgi:flavin reductase (DIM6/NTAB) family NADH-FMN oxidoreductase RutF